MLVKKQYVTAALILALLCAFASVSPAAAI